MRARRWPHVALALWCAATLSALIWPVYDVLGNHVDPLVLGLPMSLAWIVGWCLATFAVLAAYMHLTREPD